MATHAGFPKWLLDSKEAIGRSTEWSSFVEELYDAVQQQLTESHVQAFSDLTDAEKTLFMERAARAIDGGNAYKELYAKISVSLDMNLNNEVAKQLLEEYPLNTKTDLILECAQEGAVSLLRKWPDMKSKLHVCFNQPLPESLRQLAWRLFLDNTKVRKKYVELLTNKPREAISPLDLDISQKCEFLLSSEPTFSQLKSSVGAFYAMKAVLSYHHSLKRTRESLLDTDHLLCIPFLFVAGTNIPKMEPAPGHIVALLVEEYITFMESRPGYVVDSGSELHDQEMQVFATKVSGILKAKCPELAKTISDVYVPSKEMIVATEKGSESLLSDAIIALVRPVIRALFIGYVRMSVVLFLWDQYMIGLDSPGFHDEYLPACIAVFLMLLKDKLKESRSTTAMENVLGEHGLKLKVSQFQYELNRYFYSKLFAKLNQEDRAALPVLDPTQASQPPWEHWFRDMVPERTLPQDRRRAREEREAERERLLQQQREEERRRLEEERERKEEEKRFLKQAAEDKRRNEENRLRLEDELERERQRRLQSERDAAEEIERLRREVEALQRRGAKSANPSVHSIGSVLSRFLIPPPPSPASQVSRDLPTPLPPRTKTPLASKPPDEQTKDAVLDFVKRVALGFKKIGQGEGAHRYQLDEETKYNIVKHKEDFKQAELEIFGHNLKPGEFDSLPQKEREEASDKLMAIMKQRLEDRQREENR